MESVQASWIDKERLRLEELRRYYCMMQKRGHSHSFSFEEIGEWIEEVDQRLDQIKETKRRYEFCIGMDNLYEKFRSIDFYHVSQ